MKVESFTASKVSSVYILKNVSKIYRISPKSYRPSIVSGHMVVREEICDGVGLALNEI